jgi:hypothetical protein
MVMLLCYVSPNPINGSLLSPTISHNSRRRMAIGREASSVCRNGEEKQVDPFDRTNRIVAADA